MRRRDFGTLLGGMATASTVWPSLLSAQQKAMPVIGYLGGGTPGSAASLMAAFRQGLSQTGFVEGQNLTIEYRWAEGRYDRLPELANELVGRKVDVIVTVGSAGPAAKNATSTIPIVFVGANDPVGDGLVASLPRPGGNLTGVSVHPTDLNSKRLELLGELVPRGKAIAMLVNPNNSQTELTMRGIQEIARAKGMQLHVLKASTESEIDAAFATLLQRQDGQRQAAALIVQPDPFFFSRREQLVALAARHAVPAIYPFREDAAIGGLISFGSSITAAWRQAGAYAGRILKGARPAEMPVIQPTTFELVINLKTATALGIEVPPTLRERADEVIE